MSSLRPATLIVALLAALIGAAPAAALPDDPARERVAGNPTPLEQAREESAVKDRPRTRLDLRAGELRLSRSELLASARQDLEITFTLDRDVADGVLELTLPSRWVGRSDVSDLAFARVPSSGRASGVRARARRSGRVVRFAFKDAREGDSASFKLSDLGIPAGEYTLRHSWREAGGTDRATGTAKVIFYAPVREAGEENGDGDWTALMRDVNAINDAAEESETFVTVVPGNRQRYVVGANGGGGYNAWITNNGGTSFTKAPMSASIDAPGEAGPEPAALCCDPMSAADALGNVWYGGLSTSNGAGNPSRIVVARSAPATTSFVNTVGLKVRTGGTQDKPLMTIDNSPTSPTFGRLYVIWDEPVSGGGINIVIAQCDTRPGGVANAANCDNADNWTAPVSVTPVTGSYIYADVAVGPDGRVFVVWWDYSAANAVRGDICNPSGQNCASADGWGTPQTIATMNATGGPLPFECPIVAQPGGRASTSPNVDVDRSGGPNNGHVYVTWSDLRTGSGTTRCGDETPKSTHLTWDNFVASAAGTLPGSANPSPAVATRLLTDGEGGGQANSDDWFAWLAVDQTTGVAWADFYSTRDVANRTTTNFYVRGVAPAGNGHVLGPLRKVSTQPSNYSAATCCTFGNDYGDYTGIDATQGAAIPVWTDKRAGSDGEAYIDNVFSPLLTPSVLTFDDSAAAGGDGDGVLEPGESFRLTEALRNAGSAAATAVSATLTTPAGSGLTITQPTSAFPDVAPAATQTNAAAFTGTLPAGQPCGSPVAVTLRLTIAGEPSVVPIGNIATGCGAFPPPPPPPPPPVAPPPPPPVAPPPPPPPPVDRTIVFSLTGKSTQKPLVKKAGFVATLSCPLENCRVALKGTVTIPSATRGGEAKKVSLKSATVTVTRAKQAKRKFTISRSLRSRLTRALRSSRTRTRIRALITATATDAAGNKSSRTLTIKVRR